MKVMTSLKISPDKLQIAMAKKIMDPYDLCKSAGFSYQTYLRIVKTGNCKLSTLGKLCKALQCEITEILEDERND